MLPVLMEAVMVALNAVLILVCYLVYRAVAKIGEKLDLISWNRHPDDFGQTYLPACRDRYDEHTLDRKDAPSSRPEVIDVYLRKVTKRRESV